MHANLVNRIFSYCKRPIFAVPRIYSDELAVENPNYLVDFYKNLNKEIFSFYCGKFVVSKSFSTKVKLFKIKSMRGKLFIGIIFTVMITVQKD